MTNILRKLYRFLNNDESFLIFLGEIEGLVSKILSLAMVVVIIISVWDLLIFLVQNLRVGPQNLADQLILLFGLFLDILIALEVLENITAYLRNHVVQMELVVATSLTAIARKLIILDLGKVTGLQLIGLAVAIFALSISYWIVKNIRHKDSHH
jgi:uncharacterized membrane protein (DUF373 family)